MECSTDEIRNLAYQDKAVLASLFPMGFVVAVVTSKEHLFGLARMWQSQAEETKWDVAAIANGRRGLDTGQECRPTLEPKC